MMRTPWVSISEVCPPLCGLHYSPKTYQNHPGPPQNDYIRIFELEQAPLEILWHAKFWEPLP